MPGWLAVALCVAAVSATAATAAAPVSTLVSPTGKTLCRVTRDSGGYLVLPDDSSEELDVWYQEKDRTRVSVGLTHFDVGGAVPTGVGTWRVWAGRTLVGHVLRRGSRLYVTRVARRFSTVGVGLDHLRRGYVGSATGPDALAAATAYLLLGTCG